MADFTGSSASTTTTAPGYYTSYLTDLATQGQAAANPVTGAQFAGATPLQTEAFKDVAANVGNYQPSLTSAGTNLAGAAGTNIAGAASPYLSAGTTTSGLSAANPYLQQGTQGANELVGNYMNPYTQQVVDQIRTANQQNIAQNLSPGLTGGAVGAGQFGSQRGANALALGISNANLGALGQQAQALQTGYTAAMANAQQQRANQLAAGQTAGTLQNVGNANQIAAGQVAQQGATQSAQNLLNTGIQQGNLATTTQNLGLGDVNAQATLGAQQQAINQNKEMFPFQRLQAQANLMQGQQIPMSTTQTATGSPLSAIAGLGALGIGMFQKTAGGTSAYDALANMFKSNTGGTPDATAGVTTGYFAPQGVDEGGGGGEDGVVTPPPEDDPMGSDPSYKRHIVRVDDHALGIGIYSFEYLPEYAGKWGHGPQIGVMADEVMRVLPAAVSKDTDGHTVVNYSMLRRAGAGRQTVN